MVGVIHVRVLELSSHSYREDYMIKKIAKWSMLVPVKIVEWIIWPVAKVHAWLCKFADWLTMKM